MNGLAVTVDELGTLNSQIAALRAQADKLKAYLVANAGAATEVVGAKYKARISRREAGQRTNFRDLSQLLSAYVSDEVWEREYAIAQDSVKASTSVSLYDL